MERVLLVRGLKSSAGWGFPRGKVNQGERGDACAAREVEEETGMNIEALMHPEHLIQVRGGVLFRVQRALCPIGLRARFVCASWRLHGLEKSESQIQFILRLPCHSLSLMPPLRPAALDPCLAKVRSDGKLNTLYIVAGIDPETAVFAPKTKGVSDRQDGIQLSMMMLEVPPPFHLL